MGPPTLFTIPVLRYMKTYDLTHEQLAIVSVVRRASPARRSRWSIFSRQSAPMSGTAAKMPAAASPRAATY